MLLSSCLIIRTFTPVDKVVLAKWRAVAPLSAGSRTRAVTPGAVPCQAADGREESAGTTLTDRSACPIAVGTGEHAIPDAVSGYFFLGRRADARRQHRTEAAKTAGFRCAPPPVASDGH